MIAMLISVITAALILASIVYVLKGGDADIGFLVGIGLYYIVIIIHVFYFIDAILSIVKAIKKIQPIFNSILALLIVYWPSAGSGCGCWGTAARGCFC